MSLKSHSLLLLSVLALSAPFSAQADRNCPSFIEADCHGGGIRTYLVADACTKSITAYIETGTGTSEPILVKKTPASGIGTPAERPLKYMAIRGGLPPYELEVYLTGMPTEPNKPAIRSGRLTLSGSRQKMTCTLYPR